jgi:hypothetical protein
MTAKSDELANMRQAFSQRFCPKEGDDYRANRAMNDFAVDLDRLIYAAIAVGQEPFVKELDLFREHSLKTGMLAINPKEITKDA